MHSRATNRHMVVMVPLSVLVLLLNLLLLLLQTTTTITATDPTASCILITDAATGPARRAALQLADLGVHVLAGVRTDAEKRSFLFETRKGFEPVVFDPTDPATVAATVYRIKQVRLELGRPFYGAVINVGDTMRAMKLDLAASGQTVADVDAFDASYRVVVRSTVRLLQAALTLLLDPEQPTSSTTGRIVALFSDRFQAPVADLVTCGIRCTHQQTLLALLRQLREEVAPRGVGVSVVVAPENIDNGDRTTLVQQAVHSGFEWALDPSTGEVRVSPLY